MTLTITGARTFLGLELVTQTTLHALNKRKITTDEKLIPLKKFNYSVMLSEITTVTFSENEELISKIKLNT